MTEVNVHQAKTQLSQLLHRVEAGEEVIIARAGKPIARLVAVQAGSTDRPLGIDVGRSVSLPISTLSCRRVCSPTSSDERPRRYPRLDLEPRESGPAVAGIPEPPFLQSKRRLPLRGERVGTRHQSCAGQDRAARAGGNVRPHPHGAAGHHGASGHARPCASRVSLLFPRTTETRSIVFSSHRPSSNASRSSLLTPPSTVTTSRSSGREACSGEKIETE